SVGAVMGSSRSAMYREQGLGWLARVEFAEPADDLFRKQSDVDAEHNGRGWRRRAGAKIGKLRGIAVIETIVEDDRQKRVAGRARRQRCVNLRRVLASDSEGRGCSHAVRAQGYGNGHLDDFGKRI